MALDLTRPATWPRFTAAQLELLEAIFRPLKVTPHHSLEDIMYNGGQQFVVGFVRDNLRPEDTQPTTVSELSLTDEEVEALEAGYAEGIAEKQGGNTQEQP